MGEAQEALFKGAQTMAEEIIKAQDWLQTESNRILGLVGVTLGDT
jgi:hypothetical protein